jgi:hypothetical protein
MLHFSLSLLRVFCNGKKTEDRIIPWILSCWLLNVKILFLRGELQIHRFQHQR